MFLKKKKKQCGVNLRFMLELMSQVIKDAKERCSPSFMNAVAR